ncbi:uncharacterized protein [Dendrobates tinctorius]|uniref:uncharacterized protein n=1 Tax=Dendrobates tinctorius TaxID=92724 RepID=UPI003CC9A4E4
MVNETAAETNGENAAETVSLTAAETASQAAAENRQPFVSLSVQEALQLPQTVMSSPESSPSHHQRAEEADSEELPGGDVQGGETQGGGAQSSSESGAHTRVTPRTSQGRQGDASGGRQAVSQRAPRRHLEEGVIIDTDELIREVENREPLWNMANRLHADQPTTRRLWDEVTGLSHGGGRSGIASRGTTTRRCRPRVDREDAEDPSTKTTKPWRSCDQQWCAEAPSAGPGSLHQSCVPLE